MFSSLLSEEERQGFLSQNNDGFIPGYTGHCPTLKFHYGRCYGAETQEIYKDIRTKRSFEEEQKENYRSQDYKTSILKPIVKIKGQFKDYADNFKRRAPRYITGYTGFIPTMNFRYGKSYGQTADDCIYDYDTNKHRRIQMAEQEIEKMFRAQSVPRLNPIRNHKISPDYPPIAGYTGHIPRVKGNEESLSQRYNNVVKRGLAMLQKETERIQNLKKAQNQVIGVLQDFESLHNRI
ncbi:protein FAM166B-like isoform X2 [Tribolium madens]|uniref:protein FAM166B-like isoform X2 n=1 Tax=Tribolium madens TaxID=41895 RepID=UPI001CF725E5|nr:protein FAM166B-like isoform X2 [Tribolium madens]